MAVTTNGDRTARVWDLATGQTITSLPGRTESVTGVAAGPPQWRVSWPGAVLARGGFGLAGSGWW